MLWRADLSSAVLMAHGRPAMRPPLAGAVASLVINSLLSWYTRTCLATAEHGMVDVHAFGSLKAGRTAVGDAGMAHRLHGQRQIACAHHHLTVEAGEDQRSRRSSAVVGRLSFVNAGLDIHTTRFNVL